MTPREKEYIMFLGMTAVGCAALLIVFQQVNAYYRELNYEKTQNVVSQLQIDRLKKANEATKRASKQINGLADKQASTKPEDVVGWKTYRNDEFGFEFKYPPDLIAYDTQSDKDKQFAIGFNDRAGRGLTAVIFSKSWDASYIQGIADGGYSNFRVDGQAGFRFTQSMPGTPCKSESVVIPFENRTLEISFPGCPQRLQVGEIQNIIESIKTFSAR